MIYTDKTFAEGVIQEIQGDTNTSRCSDAHTPLLDGCFLERRSCLVLGTSIERLRPLSCRPERDPT